MKKSEANKLAIKIYNSMRNRLSELADRSYKRNTTDAYFVAFQIGLLADIENVLKGVKDKEIKNLEAKRKYWERKYKQVKQ